MRAPTLTTVLAALALGLVAPAAARADDDARARGTCGAGARSELRLKADDGSIRVRFRVDGSRAGARWRIVLVHERRVVWRGRRRARSNGRVRVRRSVANYSGADAVTARAYGPRGNTCTATAVLSSS